MGDLDNLKPTPGSQCYVVSCTLLATPRSSFIEGWSKADTGFKVAAPLVSEQLPAATADLPLQPKMLRIEDSLPSFKIRHCRGLSTTIIKSTVETEASLMRPATAHVSKLINSIALSHPGDLKILPTSAAVISSLETYIIDSNDSNSIQDAWEAFKRKESDWHVVYLKLTTLPKTYVDTRVPPPPKALNIEKALLWRLQPGWKKKTAKLIIN